MSTDGLSTRLNRWLRPLTWVAVVFGLIVGALTLLNFVVGLARDEFDTWRLLEWGLSSSWITGFRGEGFFSLGSIPVGLAATASLVAVGVFSLLALRVSRPFDADRPRWPVIGGAAASLAYLVFAIWNWWAEVPGDVGWTLRWALVPITYLNDPMRDDVFGEELEAFFVGSLLLRQFVVLGMVLWIIVGGLWLARRRPPQP